MAEKLPDPMVPRGPIDMTDDPDNPYGQEVKNSCRTCGHWDQKNPLVCEAFPEGIPPIIFLGYDDHTYPFKVNGVVADQGLRYTPKSRDREYPEEFDEDGLPIIRDMSKEIL